MPEVGYIVQHRLHALLNHIRTLESKVSDLSTELDKERMQTQEVVKQQAICTIGREILERSFNRDLRMLRERVELEDNQREELMIAIQEIRAEFHRIFTESLTQPVPQVLPRPFEHAVPESNTTTAETIVTPVSVDFNTSPSSLYSPLKASQTTIDDADTNLNTEKSRTTIVLQFINGSSRTHVKMFSDTQLLDLQRYSRVFSQDAVFVVRKTSFAIFAGDTPDSVRCDLSCILKLCADSITFTAARSTDWR